MRATLPLALLITSLSLAGVGHAQVFRMETPPPAVNAASASWQLSGDPIYYAGALYDPSGPTTFFDSKVMVRTGVYQTVPLYEDATLQPYSVVYVPVGGMLMRPYVRRPDSAFGVAGTSGPLELRSVDFDARARSGYALVPVETLGTVQGRTTPVEEPFEAVGVVGVAGASTGATGQQGLWIEFDGARWYSAGRSVEYDSNRFVPAGNYRGFPVYRDRGVGTRIFVTVVPNGPLAPFERR